jgi:hypothetical protein
MCADTDGINSFIRHMVATYCYQDNFISDMASGNQEYMHYEIDKNVWIMGLWKASLMKEEKSNS